MTFLFTLFTVVAVRGQEHHAESRSHQLTVSCDNNLFLLNGEDGYYTNGVFLKYDRLSRKHRSAALKRIFSYEIGQMIYNAHSRKILAHGNANFPGGIQEIDRPVTGYLFGKASCSSFYGGNKMLTLGVSVGSIGKNAFGKEVQESWHKMIGIKPHWNWVWDYQLNSETGVNISGVYAFTLVNPERRSWFQITPVTEATVGTIFTNVSQAVVLQFGKLRPMSSGSYWSSRLQENDATGSRPVELFVFYKPEARYQVYNATVQGGMLRDDKGPITSAIEPFFFSQDIGVRYSTPGYCLGYHVTFQTREAKGQFNHHAFGNLVCILRI
ncbi:DUF2219 family protein [Fulvivirgaceae bacterium PWU4]|uniref:DUF2219 family protein n=1 Tax=Chryseosolibacter histidini TaxID=2782349 RepID=A0AAP2GM03_9BACT|nr:lipid A deacylase LpxR family protein [Chryseosolibacter histidini]MBT1700986.1 DUF2219 family protein [Chryseosolibacter histidini]